MKPSKRIGVPFTCLLLAGVLLLSCISCAYRISAEELSGTYIRQAVEAGDTDNDFRAAAANFAIALLQQTSQQDGTNELISPLSAMLCLAMLANGAEGETKAQMEAVLGMRTEDLNRALYALTSTFLQEKSCKVTQANSIWFRNQEHRLHVTPEFLQTNADWYGAQIYSAPFDDTTLKDINHWVKEHTDGMIKEMLKEIDCYTVMYLINTLVFDAKWETPYTKSDIKDGTFTAYNGTKQTADMLCSSESVYLATDGASGFAKSYAGGRYSFVALLPDDGTDLYAFVNALSGDAWRTIWDSRVKDTEVSVRMPEFTCTADRILNDALIAMGMIDLFDGSKADLSALGYSEYGNLFCSEVQQKCYLEVTRNGTKAAAAPKAEIKDNCEKVLYAVTLNRPFVYAIIDNQTGVPLFLGTVAMLP